MLRKARVRGWRMRAEELRAIAEGMTDAIARQGLLTGAASHDATADRNEAPADRAGNAVDGKETIREAAQGRVRSPPAPGQTLPDLADDISEAPTRRCFPQPTMIQYA